MRSNHGKPDDAIHALALLEAEGTTVGYMTNFRRLSEPGVAPEVVITIAAEDELAMERVKRQVRKVIEPFVPGVTVAVSSDQLPKRQT